MTNDNFMRHGANAEVLLRSIDASRPWIDFLPQRYQSAPGWTGEEPWMQDSCGHCKPVEARWLRFAWTLYGEWR